MTVEAFGDREEMLMGVFGDLRQFVRCLRGFPGGPWPQRAIPTHRDPNVCVYFKYDAYRWPCVLASWKDSEHINWIRMKSSDGRHLCRGHRRKPWRWEDQFSRFYDSHPRMRIIFHLASSSFKLVCLGHLAASMGQVEVPRNV